MTVRLSFVLLVFACSVGTLRVRAETLLAAEVTNPTNIDWMALARAQKAVADGRAVRFVWQEHPAARYGEIRRTLWLAALHGVTDQTCADKRTCRLMAEELQLARKLLNVPFALDIAIRDVSTVDRLWPMLIRAQCACKLIDDGAPCSLPTRLRCHGDEVLNEESGISFASLRMAATFSHACHADNGLVFEENGIVATNVFVRRFRNGTATVVNLSDTARSNLTYRRHLRRTTFDLPSAGVVHLNGSDTAQHTHGCEVEFSSTLWKVTFEDDTPARLVDAALLPTVVDERYSGTVRYATVVNVPPGEEPLYLHLDTADAETEVILGDRPLGTRAWEPFVWLVPSDCRGKALPIQIHVVKRAFVGFLQSGPSWHTR